MEELDLTTTQDLRGGNWRLIGKAILAGLSFAIGKDLEEEWRDAWNDPYGVD